MPIDYVFWVIAILAILGIFFTAARDPARPWPWYYSFFSPLILFVLIVLLGWRVFGPALKG